MNVHHLRFRRDVTPPPICLDLVGEDLAFERLEREREARPTALDPVSEVTERVVIRSMDRVSRGLYLIAAAIVVAAITGALS